MMNKSKTKKAGLIKYALILPATFALIFASNLLLSACTADNKVINTEEATQLLASNEVVFDRVDVMPEFPGGEDALVRFLSENISYPADAYENAIQGTVIVQFVVKSDGSIADARVLQSVHPSLDNEAIRVIEAMPTWTPGEHDGKKVRTQFNIPIRFSMPD